MKSTQAWGWLAAGVLAAGLNAAYHDGGLAWAHRIADRAQRVSGAVVALASGHADRFLAEAKTLSIRNDDDATAFSDTMVATADQEMARAEAAYARAAARGQAHCARMQAEHARMEARMAAQRALGRIPAVQVQMALRSVQIPEIPAMSVPRIEIQRMKWGQNCSRVHISLPSLPKISIPAAPAMNVSWSSGLAN